MKIMAWLPILSVVLGLFAEWAGLLSADGERWGVFLFEYMTSSYRLQGINIPSGIAAIAYIAFFISIYQAILYKKNGYYAMAVVAFVITMLAGSRTPLAAEIIFAGLGIFISSGKELGGRVKLNVGVAGAVVLVLALALYWPTLSQRFMNPVGNTDVVNTSGRSDIWEIEYTAWQKNPMFGRGIGAGAIILLDEARLNLVAARATHNEYLRLLLDGGIFGLIAYLFGFAALILRDLRGTSSTTRRLTASLFLSFAIWSFFDNTISSGTTLQTFYAVALLLFQARLHQRRLALHGPD
jgi:O-antigen ligase